MEKEKKVMQICIDCGSGIGSYGKNSGGRLVCSVCGADYRGNGVKTTTKLKIYLKTCEDKINSVGEQTREKFEAEKLKEKIIETIMNFEILINVIRFGEPVDETKQNNTVISVTKEEIIEFKEILDGLTPEDPFTEEYVEKFLLERKSIKKASEPINKSKKKLRLSRIRKDEVKQIRQDIREIKAALRLT